MRWAMLGWGLLLLLPVGVKTVLPPVATAAVRNHWFGLGQSSERTLWTVTAIEGVNLSVRAPDGSTHRFTLAGLDASPSYWQQESTGVLAAVLSASQGQVSLTPIDATTALVQLPNGTLLQRILLSDGVARLDRSQTVSLPVDVLSELDRSQAEAQQQYKNIWGNNS